MEDKNLAKIIREKKDTELWNILILYALWKLTKNPIYFKQLKEMHTEIEIHE